MEKNQRLQTKLSSVVKGDISLDKLTKEAQTHLDTLLGNYRGWWRVMNLELFARV